MKNLNPSKRVREVRCWLGLAVLTTSDARLLRLQLQTFWPRCPELICFRPVYPQVRTSIGCGVDGEF